MHETLLLYAPIDYVLKTPPLKRVRLILLHSVSVCTTIHKITTKVDHHITTTTTAVVRKKSTPKSVFPLLTDMNNNLRMSGAMFLMLKKSNDRRQREALEAAFKVNANLLRSEKMVFLTTLHFTESRC